MKLTKNNNRCDRRDFIKGITVAAGSVSLLTGCARKTSAWRFFTDQEAELVGLISEQIIPADQDPGALDAGVTNFIDRQLVGPYVRHQEAYRAGLRGTEETSQEMYGRSFEELDWESQTEVLRALESGKAPGKTWEESSSASFFSLLRDHTMQGFYGSPRHGGNRNYASFRMLGISFPQVVGRNKYGA
jgi:gluconate 2-dehydrogenase gamma chain